MNQLSASGAPALHAELDRIGGDRTSANYALKLESGKSITHNRFLVPDWGTLRLNLHVPNPNGGNLRVSIQGDAPGYENYQPVGTIDLRVADGRVNPDALPEIAYPTGYADTDTNRIGYGNVGFETFDVDVPEVLRGKSAKLKFELEGNNTVYLDDVFFKSVHLKLGNPTFARPFENTHRENYLIEKPQYTLSYNDATKGPNWVSWQLNKSWLGNTTRPGPTTAPRDYPPTGFPEGTYPAEKVDYPWLGDTALPSTWVRTEGPDYRYNDRGMQKGHMTASADRSRTTKDIYSTFFTSNMLPQHGTGNNLQGSAWAALEKYSREQLVERDNRELYIIAGGFDYSPAVPPGHSDLREIHNRISTNTEGRVVLDPNGTLTPNPKTIRIPNYTWKILVPLEPGQGIADVTANTQVIAVITPNRSSRETPDPDYRLPGSPSYPNGFLPNGVTSWKNWQQWRVNVDYLEELTGYDFLSSIPEQIQEVIETDSSSPLA